MIFRRRKRLHPVFNEMKKESGYWRAHIRVSDCEIEITLAESFFEDASKHSERWEALTNNLSQIKANVHVAILGEYEKGHLPFELPNDFSLVDIEIEGLSFFSAKDIQIRWGVRSSGSDEYDYGVNTSFSEDKFEIEGVIH